MTRNKYFTVYFMFSVFFLCLFSVSSANATKWNIINNSSKTVQIYAKCNGQEKFIEVLAGQSKNGIDGDGEWGQFRWRSVTQSGQYIHYSETLYCSFNCCSTGIGDTATVTLQNSNPQCNVIWSK
jgi:hypothetical protein